MRPTDLARLAGAIAGPLAAVLCLLWLPESYLAGDGTPQSLSLAARVAAATGVWMAVWWIAEPLPVYITALLPLIVFPLATVLPADQLASAYGDPLLFLFLGGFILALSLERWGLHRRIALTVLRAVGSRPHHVIGAFMGISAFISLWVSNTATTIMLLPVALSVLHTAGAGERDSTHPWAAPLLLGVAYAASIGGLGTMIGTAPNIFVSSFLRTDLGYQMTFGGWMLWAMPLVLAFLPAAWWVLTRIVYRVPTRPDTQVREALLQATADLGAPSRGEILTGSVFLATAVAWVARPWLTAIEWHGHRPLAGLTDTGIALGAALALFLIPADREQRVFLMDWQTAERLPFGLLILFGGGLALAAALEATGFSGFLAARGAALGEVPYWVLIVGVVTTVVFLSEVASNAATAAAIVPLLAATAKGLGLDPVPIVLAACFAASCGFMLPVATPPNAIAYGTGYLTTRQMARAGLLLNLIGILFITVLTCGIIAPLIGSRP